MRFRNAIRRFVNCNYQFGAPKVLRPGANVPLPPLRYATAWIRHNYQKLLH